MDKGKRDVAIIKGWVVFCVIVPIGILLATESIKAFMVETGIMVGITLLFGVILTICAIIQCEREDKTVNGMS